MNIIAESDVKSVQTEQQVNKNIRGSDGALPIWLEVDGTPIFAWYHPASGETRHNQGIVLCNTFGSEAMLLHPAYQHSAQQWSRAGFPCLRFDYPGTGDSGGDPRDSNRLKAWLASIHCAVDSLKQIASVDEINLFGVLLGASLATQAAQERTDIRGLILWAPYLSGKNFLRAAKMQESVITANPAKLRSRRWQDGDSEAFGFLIVRDFAEHLQKLDLKNLTKNLVQRACVFVRDANSNEAKFAAALRDSGVTVSLEERVLCDINEILEKMELPHAIIREVEEWLKNDSNPPIDASFLTHDEENSKCPFPQRVELRDDKGRCWFEQGIFADAEFSLFGVLSAPAVPSINNNIGVILVNGGANHRVGINRNYTEWSRGWAAKGFTVLRLDVRGLGDSPARSDEQRNSLYLDSTIDDIEATIQYLKRNAGVKSIVLLGLCAGAYQCLRYAVERKGLDGLVLINPLRFQKPQNAADGIQKKASYEQFADNVSFFSHAYFFANPFNWRQLIRWRRRSLNLLTGAIKRLPETLPSLLRMKESRIDNSQKDVLLQQLQDLASSGTDILLLCSTDETILPLLKVALSKGMKTLKRTGKFHFYEMHNTNHILAPLWSQEKAFEVISGHLDKIRGLQTE